MWAVQKTKISNDAFQLWKDIFNIKNENDKEQVELTFEIEDKLEFEDILSRISPCDEIEVLSPPCADFAPRLPTSSSNFLCP